VIDRLVDISLGLVRRLDRACNRLYGWRFNPLYQTGTLVVLLLVILIATGIYLLIFYRVGAPWQSVAGITDQAWAGRWLRTLHRYASDAAIPAIAIHAFRMFAQRRTWGPRALAWVSGVLLAIIFFACGWTGYVMVWDVQGQLLAIEGARFLDALPIFSEPLGRTFVGSEPLPGAFFFMNLFLHIVLPIGVGVALWIHVSRIARPTLLPPRGLWAGAAGFLIAVSILWPIGMATPAAVSHLPADVPLDLFYGFWVPPSRAVPTWIGWLAFGGLGAVALLIPRITRPSSERQPPPSRVEERYCTECYQCTLDCPYEAIAMVPRADGRFELVARVDPTLCVSCGICAGSCAPMGVGPAGRTGRDQLAAARELLARERSRARDMVVIACSRAAYRTDSAEAAGITVAPVSCAGSIHTSLIELFLRSGMRGVAIVACPPRDCWNREGVKWLEARIFKGREAELKPRVARARIRIFNPADPGASSLEGAIEAFRLDTRSIVLDATEADASIDARCDPSTVDPSAVPVRTAR